jgi:hypothetical protein
MRHNRQKNDHRGERPKVLTWHIHGTYLYYLTQANCDFYLPVAAALFPGATTCTRSRSKT